ncbi:MAG TPA: class I SAM-dependent methyltransferase [Thermoplasmata archaeon]|nr:class I SAM-dependent methyltransferase [Thermoplasmata archaeon]
MSVRSHRPRPTARADSARSNLASWERTAERYERRHAHALGRDGGEAWGLFRIPEHTLRMVGPVRGRDVLELGCGAAWWSIALARRGARVIGVDFSPVRLSQASARVRSAGRSVALVRARAERLPCADASFDLVLSDYGATTFADPRRTIPEAARVLRPGGHLVFAHASPWRSVCESPRSGRPTQRLVRPYFGIHALRTPGSTEFQLTYGEWIDLFRASGLSVERLVEPSAVGARQSTYVSRAGQRWARRWPIETIWKLVRLPGPTGRRRPRRARRPR